MSMEQYIIKSKSGKDIRDLVYSNNQHILTFKNDESYNDFIDFVTSIISYFGFFTLDDILAYYNQPHDFISSKDYGWGVEDLDMQYCFTCDNTGREEIIYVLPPPKPINEIDIPSYIG